LGLEDVGYLELTKSGRGFKIVLHSMPDTVFTNFLVGSLEGLREVLDGKRKRVSVKLIIPGMRNASCEKKELKG
jgi:hypothetical protein